MNEKLARCIEENHDMPTPEPFLGTLCLGADEIDDIDKKTTQQWRCEGWYIAKKGFITASECKNIVTRQQTLQKNST